jgi:hypothetical protein
MPAFYSSNVVEGALTRVQGKGERVRSVSRRRKDELVMKEE